MFIAGSTAIPNFRDVGNTGMGKWKTDRLGYSDRPLIALKLDT